MCVVPAASIVNVVFSNYVFSVSTCRYVCRCVYTHTHTHTHTAIVHVCTCTGQDCGTLMKWSVQQLDELLHEKDRLGEVHCTCIHVCLCIVQVHIMGYNVHCSCIIIQVCIPSLCLLFSAQQPQVHTCTCECVSCHYFTFVSTLFQLTHSCMLRRMVREIISPHCVVIG